MKIALCVSGDFKPSSQAIAMACRQLMGQHIVDVYAFLWTEASTSKTGIHSWLTQQLPPNVRLRRWSFDSIRPIHEWDKFIKNNPKASPEEFEKTSRKWLGLQSVSQMKAEQERVDGADYDAILCIDSSVNLISPVPLPLLQPLLADHVIVGIYKPMPWWPEYDYRIAISSSRNMDVYSAIQTLHRRQYFLRNNTLKPELALVDHLRHARLKVCALPLPFEQC
jgi:hypothetical protein